MFRGMTSRRSLKPISTTIELPPELWRAAKIRAVEEHSNLRTIIIRALTAYLATPARS